jgi:hypothetical protein
MYESKMFIVLVDVNAQGEQCIPQRKINFIGGIVPVVWRR